MKKEGLLQERVYTTQLLLETQRKNETAASFFARVLGVIWEWFPEVFPDPDGSGKMITDEIPFDDFLTNEMHHVGDRFGRTIEWRGFRTARLLIRALSFRVPLESSSRPGYTDSTHVTEICVESSTRMGELTSGVRLSFTSYLEFQPFAGFYPQPEIPLLTPGLIGRLRAMSDCTISFFPKVRNAAEHRLALRYPVLRGAFVIGDEVTAGKFLKLLSAPYRPVCMVVFFGDSKRVNAEVAEIAEALWSKAYVCHVKNPTVVGAGIAKSIPGFEIKRHANRSICRVFFPQGGQYLTDDAANPTYTLSMMGGSYRREQLLNGMFRFFDTDESGWRRNIHDVVRLYGELQRRRRLEALRAAAANKEKTIATLNAGMKSAQKAKSEIVDSCEQKLVDKRLELDLITEENTRLNEQIVERSRELSAAISERDLAKLELAAELQEQTDRLKALDTLPSNLESFKGWSRLLTRLEIADRAWDGLKGRGTDSRFLSDVWEKLWALNAYYFEVFDAGLKGDLQAEFRKRSGYEISFKENQHVMDNKQWAAERSFEHDGKMVVCWPHVKGGTGKNKGATRVYFVKPTVGDVRIVVGWLGSHLTTGTSRSAR